MVTHKARMAAAGSAVIACAALGVPIAAHAAPSTPKSPDSAMLGIDGDMVSPGGMHLLAIRTHGVRMHGRTTGWYDATVMDGRNRLPIQVHGPVTCIHTSGDTASLVYPITSTTPQLVPPGAAGAFAVQITVRKGRTDRVGVNGPMPTSSFHGCLPKATPNRFEGSIDIR